jgi:hypothetical protein
MYEKIIKLLVRGYERKRLVKAPFSFAFVVVEFFREQGQIER